MKYLHSHRVRLICFTTTGPFLIYIVTTAHDFPNWQTTVTTDHGTCQRRRWYQYFLNINQSEAEMDAVSCVFKKTPVSHQFRYKKKMAQRCYWHHWVWKGVPQCHFVRKTVAFVVICPCNEGLKMKRTSITCDGCCLWNEIQVMV